MPPTRAEWKAKLDALPPKLTLREAAKRVGYSYRLTATWARRLNYAKANGHSALWTAQRRRQFQRVPWTEIPWENTNAQIARLFGISREIVRRRRAEYGHAISNK